MKKYLTIIFCFTSFILIASGNYSEGKVLYCHIDRFRFRDAPGLKSNRIGYFAMSEKIVCTGNVTDFKEEIKLFGVTYNEPWVEVKRTISSSDQDTAGWVYAAGLKEKMPSVKDIHWRAVIIYDPADPDDDESYSEDWGWFTMEVGISCAAHGIIIETGAKDEKVKLTLNDDNVVFAEINLKNALSSDNKELRGYIVIEKGKKPEFINHSMTDEVLSEKSKYFDKKIENVPL